MSEDNQHISYSAADIEKYWKGELSAVEMHAMERAALEDPFLADAMEGVRGLEFGVRGSASTVRSDINDLEKRLAERIAGKQVIPVQVFNWWKVAAAVVVLVGGIWLYSALNNKNQAVSIAKKETTKNVQPVIKNDSNRSFLNTTDSVQPKDVVLAEKKKTTAVKNAPLPIKTKESKSDLISDSSITTGLISQREELAKNEDKKAASADIARSETNQRAIKPAAEINQKAKGTASDAEKENDIAGRANNTSANTFNGKVVDQANQPVVNAVIQIPNLNIATQTDKKGFFSFKAPDTALSVSVASVGFETQNLKLQNSAGSANQITLKPNSAGLDEVVIIGYGRKKRSLPKAKDVTIKILDAEPFVSWDAYDDYLEKNKQVPDEVKDIHGEVVVDFTVNSYGQLKNFNIQKSLHKQLDEEATRLIKQGPSWHLLKGKKAKASVRVKF